MRSPSDFLFHAVATGVGATAVLDLWGLYAARAFRSKGLDMGLFGRWLGHLAMGRLRHDSIAAASPIAGERVLGWSAHYLIGVVFAAVLLAAAGVDWSTHPTPWPALGVGLLTVAFPLLVLQPLLGAGLASSRTPDPAAARLRSLGSHLVFGFGLYLTASAWAQLATS
jgi:hypothetical protein